MPAAEAKKAGRASDNNNNNNNNIIIIITIHIVVITVTTSWITLQGRFTNLENKVSNKKRYETGRLQCNEKLVTNFIKFTKTH